MTGEIGQLALCLTLVLALVQTATGFGGAAYASPRLMAACRSSAIGSLVFVALAFGALSYAYVQSDFSVLAVAQNSHTDKPLLYKISGVWGNHEGSMLLWLLILTLYSAVIAMAGARAGDSKLEKQKLKACALAVQGLVAIAFLLFVLLTSSPFWRVYPPPFQGQGLNPLLQDPGLAFHPPLLYLGYVGLSATFSFAAAAMIAGKSDAMWVRSARPYVLLSWTALTLGIAAGSWWAYYTLGWGGFWFWDPVENASLMPWLVATALLHSMMATERTGAFKSWTLLLAVTAFSFSLIGTFLVRSGVLNSVHAFANDPERGIFILAILVISIGGSLALFAWQAPKLAPGAPFAPVSRESAILVNNLLLTAAAATVLVGTLYPLALDAIDGRKISVGPPYFTATVIPIFMFLAVCLPFGLLFTWRRADLRAALYALRYALAAALIGALIALFVFEPFSMLGLFAALFGAWLIAAALTDLRRRAGRWMRLWQAGVRGWSAGLAHAGLGVLALGVAGASVWNSEALAVMSRGDTMQVAAYTLRFEGSETVQGPNYTAERAVIAVLRDGNEVTKAYPEKRTFSVQGNMTTTDSAIRTTFYSDLYIVLGDPRGEGFVVRAYFNPMAPFIWLGGLLMGFGGLTALGGLLRRRDMKAAARTSLAREAGAEA